MLLSFNSVSTVTNANVQNSNKGVSEDIIKLPREAAGVKIQIKEAILADLLPKIEYVPIHIVIDIKKCIMGEHILTAHSSCPNIFVEKAIIQAIIGGLVK
jgi:hypothetical protein